jgi:hypothetical protein
MEPALVSNANKDLGAQNMEDKQSFEGGCTCGCIRFEMECKPMYTHACHCTWCQRETGSSYAVNALIESGYVNLLAGSPEKIATPSSSGGGQDIVRCPQCKVAVWSYYSGRREKLSFVRVGTLDNSSAIAPDIHIFTSTKHPWVHLPEGTNAVLGYYRRSEHWNDDSMARWKKMETG